jgi:hypothetical protein
VDISGTWSRSIDDEALGDFGFVVCLARIENGL